MSKLERERGRSEKKKTSDASVHAPARASAKGRREGKDLSGKCDEVRCRLKMSVQFSYGALSCSLISSSPCERGASHRRWRSPVQRGAKAFRILI